MRSHIILVFEPEATGHHTPYLEHLFTWIEMTIANPCLALLTTADAAAHPNFIRLVEKFGHFLEIRIARAPARQCRTDWMYHAVWGRQFENAEMLAQGIDDLGPDSIACVVLPHMEAVGLGLLALRPGIFRGRPWIAIMNGAKFHHRQVGIAGPRRWQDWVQRWLFRQVMRQPGLVRMLVVDPYFAQTTSHAKIVWAPDPVVPTRRTDPVAARAFYHIRPETCVILVFGFIGPRKCVSALLKAVSQLPPDLDVTVLLAGSQHSRLRDALAVSAIARSLRADGRLIEVDRYIMEDQDPDPMGVADICWVFYDQSWVMPSGVLLLAGVAGRPVICRRQGVIGRLVTEHECGLALPSDDPGVIGAAIADLARDPAAREQMGENGRRAFASQTPERFAQPVIEAIGATLTERSSATTEKQRFEGGAGARVGS